MSYIKLGRRELREAIETGWRFLQPGEVWSKIEDHPVTGERVKRISRLKPGHPSGLNRHERRKRAARGES